MPARPRSWRYVTRGYARSPWSITVQCCDSSPTVTMYPFEYPLEWAEEGRGWNEAYVLRAFLAYNDAFEIVLFNDLIWQHFEDVLERDFPLWIRNRGASIWLRKR